MDKINLNLNSITSKVAPLIQYVNQKREDEKFYQSLELNATIFLIIFFLVFFIRPTVFTISSLIGDIKAKETQKTQLKAKINQIIRAQDTYAQAQGRYEILSQCLPDSPKYYHIATQVQKNGSQTGIPADDIKFSFNKSDDQTSVHLKEFTLPLGFTGDFTQLNQFLTGLLNNRRLLQVPNISFSVDKNSTESAKISARLTTKVYYWLPDNEKK